METTVWPASQSMISNARSAAWSRWSTIKIWRPRVGASAISNRVPANSRSEAGRAHRPSQPWKDQSHHDHLGRDSEPGDRGAGCTKGEPPIRTHLDRRRGRNGGPCCGNRHWRTGGIEWCVHGRIGYGGWALARLGCGIWHRTGGRRRGAAGLSPRRSLTDMVSAL